MAIYVLNMKTFGRSNGSSAPGASAYRAGERIRDERTGRTYDHTLRRDVMHKEILLPARFADIAPDWTRDRAALWNAAEAAESRRNARVAREVMVALPAELMHEQRVALVRGFAQELADRHGFAVDLAVHAPREGVDRDPRNFHAHLLATTREVTSEGLGAKTILDLSDAMRMRRGLEPFVNEVDWTRRRWASAANDALRAAQVEARVDHRSLAAQGIDREPVLHLPRSLLEIERRGEISEVAERLRAEHEARCQARLARSAAAERPARPQSLEEIRREARESWLKSRQAAASSPPQARSPGPVATPAAGRGAGRAPGDDFSR